MSEAANPAGAESVAQGVFRKRFPHVTEFELNNSFGDYHAILTWEKPPSVMALLKLRKANDKDWFEIWLTPVQRVHLSNELLASEDPLAR
jgi:hypothetical protein